MTNSELEGAIGGHEVTPLLIEVTRHLEGVPPPTWHCLEYSPGGREGEETPRRGAAFFSNNPPLLKVNADRRGGGWGGGFAGRGKHYAILECCFYFKSYHV